MMNSNRTILPTKKRYGLQKIHTPTKKCSRMDGKLHGLHETYTQHGQVITRARFSNGVKVGKEEHFYPDGKPRFIGSYDEYGMKQGYQIQYHANGIVKVESFYKDDDLHGCYVKTLMDGSLELQQQYDNGLLHGEQLRFFPTGKTHRTFYKNGIEVTAEVYRSIGAKREHKITREEEFLIGIRWGLKFFPHNRLPLAQRLVDYYEEITYDNRRRSVRDHRY